MTEFFMRYIQIRFYFFIVCLSFSFSVEAQKPELIDTAKLKCTYQFKFLTDSTKKEYKEKELYIVNIGKNFSKGYCYQKFYLDSLLSTDEGRKKWSDKMTEFAKSWIATGGNDALYETYSTQLSPGLFQSFVYKDYKKEKITVTDNISIHYFYYEEELKSQDWTIKKDTMNILGYSCQKAICQWRGRDWEAWFTTDIPISEGPWKFYGLPGLIMKLQDTESHYSFTIIGLQQVNEPIYMAIKKGSRKTDRLTFLKLKMGVTGVDLNAMDLEKAGLTPDTEKKRYDDIERDYK